MKPQVLRKALPFAGGEIQENSLRATISTVGNLDSYGDVILPGAFDGCLEQFVAEGFLAVGHDWDDLPVGWIESAAMEGRRLVAVAKFHTTDEAQQARTVCIERLAAGKTVSTSIGFMIDYAEGTKYFGSGVDLMTWAKGAGYDLTQFSPEVALWERSCRAILKVRRLCEFSFVVVPANPEANEAEAKTAPPDQPSVDVAAQLRALDLDLLQTTIAG
jgi:phage head maturation protease